MELLLELSPSDENGRRGYEIELLKKSGASDAQLKGLVEKKYSWTEKRDIDRIQYLPKDIKIDFELTAAQEKAFDEIEESLRQNKFACCMELLPAAKHMCISN